MCEADKAFIFRYENDTYCWGAGYGLSPEYKEYMQRQLPRLAPGRGSLAGRVALVTGSAGANGVSARMPM